MMAIWARSRTPAPRVPPIFKPPSTRSVVPRAASAAKAVHLKQPSTKRLDSFPKPSVASSSAWTTQRWRHRRCAIELARKLGAALDDASSFSYGPLIERILRQELPTCSLSEVKDKADLLLYWGANPTATHPRHLSKYTYYAYADFSPAGWYPKVTLSSIDVRPTELTAMSKPAFRIKPRGDQELISGLVWRIADRHRPGQATLRLVKKSRFCAIFCGLGLVHSLDGDFSGFSQMVHLLGKSLRIAVIPMIAETNMVGFNQSLHKQISYVNQASFAGGVSTDIEFSFLEQVHNRTPDCILVVGSDPFSMLPQSLMNNLEG